MIKKVISALLLNATLVLGSMSPANAADIFRSPKFKHMIVFSGEIKAGDFDKLSTLISKSYVSSVRIYSQGGDAYEALRISELLNDKLIEVEAPTAPQTRVGDDGATRTEYGVGCNSYDKRLYGYQIEAQDCICNSACAIIWLTAPFRNNRITYLHFTRSPAIGVHRPRFDHAYFAGLDDTAAQAKYNKMTKQLQTFLENNEVPPEVISKMMSTPSSDIYTLPQDLAQSVGAAKPYLAELVHSRCMQFEDNLNEMKTATERLQYLEDKSASVGLTEKEKREYESTESALAAGGQPYEDCSLLEARKMTAKAQGIQLPTKKKTKGNSQTEN